ncbi:MAG: protein kinase [Planctomycetes bacterium]|nr:protein kinase [Planctomycetota bacterium]
MNRTSEQHPSFEILGSLALGQLDDSTFNEVEGHVARCNECAHVLAESQGDSFTALLQSAQSFSDTAVSLTQAATLTTPMPAGKGQLTAIWQCSGAPESIEVPTLLADHPRYRPLRLLGQGGMGAVWLAEHKVMGRQVAVKVIRPEILAKPGAADRFRREAQSAARLHHPNIVTAFDADEAGDTPLLVMEYVEGVSLADEVRTRGPLPITEACDAIRQAALGLQHAHEKGLVHRDLKPQNLMRTPDGTIKILDFGLAVLFDAGTGQAGLTGVNMVVGTPDYIASEQAEDSHLAEFKSDVYALGCTLYHLLTGRVPFPDESILRKLDGHRTQEPKPIRALRPELPEGLAAVVAKMMAKQPGDRYESAAAVAKALEPFTRVTAPQRPARSARYALVALLALAAGLIGWLNGPAIYRFSTNQGLLTIETTDDDIEVRVTQGGEEVRLIDNKTGREVTLRAGTYQLEIAKGKDGLTLSAKEFTLHRGSREIVRVSFDPKAAHEAAVEKALRELEGTWRLVTSNGIDIRSEDESQVWTFTGNRVEARLGGRPYKYQSATVKRIDPTAKPRTADLDWKGHATNPGDSSSAIYKIEGDTLHWCHSYNQAPRPSTFQGGGGVNYSIWKRVPPVKVGEVRRFHWAGRHTYFATFSPDSRYYLVTGVGGARVWEVATGKQVLEFPGNEMAAFTPDGKQILSTGLDKKLHLWDFATGKEVRPFAAGHTALITGFHLSPDGKQAATGSLDRTVRVWDVASGKELAVLADHYLARYTPDGRHFVTWSKEGWHLWDATTFKKFSTWKFSPTQPQPFQVMGDGRQMVGVAKNAAGEFVVQWWDWGRDEPVRVLKLDPKETQASLDPPLQPFRWSTDLRRLLYISTADGTVRYLDLVSGKEIVRFDVRGPIPMGLLGLSPDGRYAAGANGDGWVYLWRLPEPTPEKVGEVRRIDWPGRHMYVATFSPDSRYYLVTGMGSARVWEVATGKQVLEFPGNECAAFTPDGKQILSTASDKKLHLYDFATGKEVHPFAAGHTDWINGIRVRPDGKQAATGSLDKSVRVWDIASGKELAVLAGHYLSRYTDDGRHLVTWSRERWYLWDTTTFKEVHSWKHSGATKPWQIWADSRQVEVVGKNAANEFIKEWWNWGGDKPARVLKLEPREIQAHLDKAPPHAWSWSADGRRLLYASTADATVRYLDLESGKEIVRFDVRGPVPMGNLGISPDGRYAAGASGDGWVIYLWRLPGAKIAY